MLGWTPVGTIYRKTTKFLLTNYGGCEMSQQVSTAHVKQFSANVFHLSQQKGSRFRPSVRQESLKGKSGFYDRIGQAVAIKKASRHSDTPQIDTPHSRRRVTMVDYEYADLVDQQDKIRTLFDPANPYAQAAVWALGRAMDDEIILGALGTAYGGEEGSVAVSLPNSQKVAAHDGATTTGVNFNIKTWRKVKEKFDANDVDESIMRYIAITSSQLQALLGENEITSADYNTIKALVQGEVDSFMGMKVLRSERLGRSDADVTYNVTDGSVGAGTGTVTAANSRRCFAWAQDGILLAVGMDIRTRIQERADKSFSTQVYASLSLGATRMEEEKVVEVICSE